MTQSLPPVPQPQYVVVQHQNAPGNGFAIASLILGIGALVVGIVPLFIGLFLSFVPMVLAVVFGILGLVRSGKIGRGFVPALLGLIFGCLVFLLYFVGFGTIW